MLVSKKLNDLKGERERTKPLNITLVHRGMSYGRSETRQKVEDQEDFSENVMPELWLAE